jgi:hypothetical protein
MGRSQWRRTVAALLALAVLVVSGCSDPSTDPGSGGTSAATSPSAAADGVRYALPEQMCAVVDLTALKDLYPEEEGEDQHLLNSEGSCATAVIGGPGRVLGLKVEVNTTSDSALAQAPSIPRTYFEEERQFATDTPTDIDGVGTAAFWFGDESQLWLVTYDGNLNLKIWAYVVSATHALAPDLPERLVQVAAATLARLAG